MKYFGQILGFLFSLGLSAHAASDQAAIKPSFSPGHWVPSWVSMPQLTETTNLPPPPFNDSRLKFLDATLRQTIHMTIPGDQIRVRFTNVFSDVNLNITKATVALPLGGMSGASAIVPSTLQTLTFSGLQEFSIPNGAQIVSDPLNFKMTGNDTLAITLFLAHGQASESITSHPGSRATTFIGFGDQTTAANISAVTSVQHWYFLDAVEVWSPTDTNAIIIVGDSLTDGRGSTTDGNDRWPDQLFYRILADKSLVNKVSVLNQAAGGNRILADGLGPNALGRIDRDVLAQNGGRWAIIWEGVNDIGVADATIEAQQAIETTLIAAFNQIITRVHAKGLPIYAGTITPFCGAGQAYCDPAGIRDATRNRVNNWIRTSGRFDAVFDFDKAVRNPANVSELLPSIDTGDHLHMTPAGYAIIAGTIPLNLFTENAEPGGSGFT